MDIRCFSAGDLPAYSSEGAAAFDLRCHEILSVRQWGKDHELIEIDTGLIVEIPRGFGMLILPRSGLGSKGVVLRNMVPLIDPDFRGTIKLNFLIHERDYTQFSDNPLNPGNRVAQGVVVATPRINFIQVPREDLSSTARGTGGFGSTGIS